MFWKIFRWGGTVLIIAAIGAASILGSNSEQSSEASKPSMQSQPPLGRPAPKFNM